MEGFWQKFITKPPAAASSRSSDTRTHLIVELVRQVCAFGGLILCMKIALSYLDPYKEQREQAKQRAKHIYQRLGRAVQLNEYEQLLSANVLNPASIDVTLKDINGLNHIVQDMELKVLTPLLNPELYNTTLWRQTKGVLLYGPPGTGKTMLAKALARESNCFLLNVTASAIMSKWLGDANKLIRSVFTLAQKLQPCIIFIDEVDAILGKRGMSSEHEATLQAKTEFMQLWDGMESCRGQRLVVLGATNRPWMLDEAVLRRFSLQYELGLPKLDQRRLIIQGYLRKHHDEVQDLAGGVDPALLDSTDGAAAGLDWLAEHTEGFSGSDLMELCSQAAQHVLNEYWLSQRDSSRPASEMRMVTLQDFKVALKMVRPSTSKANDYQAKVWEREDNGDGLGAPELMKLLMRLASVPRSNDGAGGSSS